ncbi:MAG: hypothetical protein KAU58_04405, partial [Candidatus Omnitrophica bacterium]|nr:hypothetical protein [Candidatus Omnitrophota bacterium]
INLLLVPPLVVHKMDTRHFTHCDKKLLIIKKLLLSIWRVCMSNFLTVAPALEQKIYWPMLAV